jgi:acid phosphatase
VIGVIGDWGVKDPALGDVIRLMGGFNGGRPLDAVVTTGDNAYVTGTSAEAAYARRQLTPLLRRGTRLYASLGNHDEYTLGGRPVMRAFGIKARWYTAVVGPVQLVVLDANRTDDPAQLAFIKRTLAAPRPVPYRVLVFHQPVGSCSYHGPEPGVVKNWLPLFGGRVDLVLNGHNHTYERFTGPAGTPYVTTGGGGARLYPSARIACRGPVKVSFLDTVYHAVRLTATPQRLVVEAIGLDGTAFDSVTVYPRRR